MTELIYEADNKDGVGHILSRYSESLSQRVWTVCGRVIHSPKPCPRRRVCKVCAAMSAEKGGTS